ncbi:glycosyltransferase family 2 protein [Winogradskyella wichelsiae]|uniref:glycosyltransferase family 2 protein n=1 Tax=Winogradskyella wichelsiae TaxID=2697007 RepID=UPI0015CE0864|nr:glycosyltransferase family A protein [Winogradskyella wichelsiae]
MKKVSVIIPLYNASEFLSTTINSVLKQSYSNIEVIIIDDNSTDDSFDKALSFKSDNLMVVKNKGKGACSARNYGFDLSTGDYIQFLDADDILSPDKIEKQVKALKGALDQLAVCNTIHFIDRLEDGICTDGNHLFSTSAPEKFFINLWGGNSLPTNMVQTSAWLTPRAIIENAGPWNNLLAKDQDGEFFARVGLQSKGIVYVSEVKNYYRKYINGSNIASHNKREHLESNLLATDLKAKYLFSKTESKSAKKAIASQFKWVAIEAWPMFPGITRQALKKSNKLGGSDYLPVLGGKIIETIKFKFGWKLAKAVSYYGHLYSKTK